MPNFRRLALIVTIGSFSIAALLGVLALLSGGDFGEGEVNVLLTTLAVGVTSVGVLCYLATGGTPFRVVGIAGALVAIPTLVIALLLIWTDIADDSAGVAWKLFGVGTTVAATLAQVCLLLVLAAVAAPYVRVLLVATLLAATWVAVEVSAMIVVADSSDGWIRLLGVVAILDVLGTVTVAAMAKFGGDRSATSRRLSVPADLTAQLCARAEATGQSPETVLRTALVAGLEDAGPSPAEPVHQRG